jgi:membrane protein
MKKIWQKILLENPHLEKWDKWLHVFTLPGLDGVPVYTVLSFFISEIRKNSLAVRAKSIAYSFFLSLFPALLFIFTLIPYVLILLNMQNIDAYILKLIKDVSPSPEIFKFLKSFIQPFLSDLTQNKRPSLLTSTFILTIFLTSNGVVALMSSFDKSYDHYKKRNAIHTRVVALKITFLLVFLFIFSMALVVAGQDILELVLDYFHIHNTFTNILFNLIRYSTIILLFFFSISLIYYYGPATKKKYRFISTGATVATFLSILASIGFSYYVKHFVKLNTLFGSIGTVMILMIWLNINAFVLLIGYEINAAIYYHKSNTEKM